ncbi:zinc finger, C2H2 type [Trichuris suis]|nr:zinc finger, C2H2 type [Trichuris suis]
MPPPPFYREKVSDGKDVVCCCLQEELEEPDETVETHPDRDVITAERNEQTESSSSVDISSDPTSQFLKAYADSVASLVCVYCTLQLPSAEHLYLHMVQQHAPDMQANDPAMQAQDIWPSKGPMRDTSSASSTSSSTSSALQLVPGTAAEDTKPQQVNIPPAPSADVVFRCNSCRRHFRAQRNLDAHKRKKHQHRTVSALLSADSSTTSAGSNDALLGNVGAMTSAQQNQQQQQLAWTNLLAQNFMYQAAMGQSAAPATTEQQNAYGQQQQQAITAAALGAYMPSMSDMTCPVCRQLTVLFQSHLLAAHSPTSGVIGQSSMYNAELTAALAASALLQQGAVHASNGQLVALDLSAKTSSAEETGIGRGGAYCELCQKEFCNKYFLRTHKLNMHGIYADDHHSPQTKQRTPVKQSCSGDVPLAAAPPTSNGCASPSSGGELETSAVADSDLFPPLAKQSRKAEMGSELSSEGLIQNVGKASQMTASLAAAPIGKEGATAGGNILSCNLCVKSFPSFFALIAHRYRDHGSFDSSVLSPYVSLGGSARIPVTPMGHILPVAGTYGHELDNESVLCDICNREIASRYFLRFHLKNVHGIDPPDVAALSLKMGSSRERLGRSTSSGSSSSGVKNFCEICKKELCNKYFLRTHMLKMHGIVIDDHKVVIGSINNVDNGNGSSSTTATTAAASTTVAAAASTVARSEGKRFQCCHCGEEVASTMELKTHFDQMHGSKAMAEQNGPPQATSRLSSEAPSGGDP